MNNNDLVNLLGWPIILGCLFWYTSRKKHPSRSSLSAFIIFAGTFGGICLTALCMVVAAVAYFTGTLDPKASPGLSRALAPVLGLLVIVPAWSFARGLISRAPGSAGSKVHPVGSAGSAQQKASERLAVLERIISDYGQFLEGSPVTVEIMDEDCLPHSKDRILAALCTVLSSPGVDANDRVALVGGALTLANFQKGVGRHALHPFGLDISRFDSSTMSPENLAKLITSNPAGKERYESLRPLVEADRERISEQIKEAELAYQSALAREPHLS
jgi:hypothetical protein